MSTMRVITKQVGGLLEEQEVEKGLSTMQALVTPDHLDSSYIERVCIPGLIEHGIDLYVNEEGKFNGCEPNFPIFDGQDWVFGPAFFSSSNHKGETIGLTGTQARIVRDFFA